MDKIKLSNNTVFEIEDGASLNRIVISTKSAAKAQQAAAAFTPGNLAHVEFMHGEDITGIYNDLVLTPVEEGENNTIVEGKAVIVSLSQG